MLKLSLIDRAIVQIDTLLRAKTPTKTYPAEHIAENSLFTAIQKKESVSLMRVNHAGEVCAHALYQGQAMFAKNQAQHAALMQAAIEENDHLNWCSRRIQELDGRTSRLNPVWFAGSFVIGAVAGACGDKISLGFLAATEYQVSAHLEKHLNLMPINDCKSRAILEQMRQDELQHATNAMESGATELPKSVKSLMRYTAKILTVVAAKI